MHADYPNGVIRAKGLFWLASRPNQALNFSQAGGSSRLESAGVWWCSMPKEERMRYQSFRYNREIIEGRWNDQWGDRLNEIVFIGQNIEKEKMMKDLESCLLNEKEENVFNDNKWTWGQSDKFKDPFPKNI